MAKRSFRENSQIIGAFLASTYTIGSSLIKTSYGSWVKDDLEFKSKEGSYLGISQQDNEILRQFLYRLDSSNPRIEFIRSNTLDYFSFGSMSLRHGAKAFLPVSHFAHTKEDLVKWSPPTGFGHLFTQRVPTSLILNNDRISSSVLLNEEARRFGLARSLASADRSLALLLLNQIVDLFAISAAFVASYTLPRTYKLQYYSRRRVYVFSWLSALIAVSLPRLFALDRRIAERSDDLKACNMGLDCCEGSISFYDSLLERNKALREALPNGKELIDEEGNLLKEEILIPVVNYRLLVNYRGLKLTERRDACRQELMRVVAKMSSDQVIASREKPIDKQEISQDKEWAIFKKLRLKLEGMKGETK